VSRISSFQEFWPFYLSQHLHPASRALHFFGTTAAFAVLGLALIGDGRLLPLALIGDGRLLPLALIGDGRLLPLALLAGYGPAWVGHFVFEKNRPATFRYPLWSLLGDFKMWGLMASGRLNSELKRLGLESASGARQ